MKLTHLCSSILACASALLPPVFSAAESPISLAQRRSALLQRGVNLSGWFGGTSDLSAQHIATYITPADLKLIHDSGMQYVRLCVDPVQLTQHGLHSPESIEALARIDHALDQIQAAQLAVQITVFPSDEYKQQLATQAGVDRFVLLWRFLAAHFAPRDADQVFFEVLNEPEVNDLYRWMGIQATTIAAIRALDPTHTIIATGAHYSGLDDLIRLQPVGDTNVIYTFHFYEPFPFTHQSATWGSSEWLYFHDIPYPPTLDNLRPVLASIPDEQARYVLFQYGAGGWNQSGILARLQFAREWGDTHHVPVICNEFGAYRDTAPPDSRARYLHDVRTSLEQIHVGWAMWDFNANFGMVERGASGSKPDAATFDALGLKVPPAQ